MRVLVVHAHPLRDSFAAALRDTIVATLHEALERGINFFDTADSYGQGASERLLGKLIRGRRQQALICTKAGYRFKRTRRLALWLKPAAKFLVRWSAAARKASSSIRDRSLNQSFSPDYITTSVEGSLRRLGTDYIDICLMHCLTEGDWTERYKGVMDVLSEAKQKGMIRAHGCSCHSIEALRAAAKSPWVEVDLARVNPIASHMDADPDTVVGVLRQMKAAGKAVIGMKILGQGDMRERQDEALKYALSLGVLDAFTIGAESRAEQEDLIRRVSAAA